MAMPANPPQDLASPFAAFRGHHVGIRVPDFEAARDWYVTMLDFRVLHEWIGLDLSWAYLSPAADDNFHIELIGGPLEHPAPVLDSVFDSLPYGGYLHFCLDVSDLDAARAELVRRGVDTASDVFDNPDVSRRVCFVRDPWGNMIELVQRYPDARS